MRNTIAKVPVLYEHPIDPATFDSYYWSTHIPIAKKLPGLLAYNISGVPPRMLAGKAPYLVAELEFADMAALDTALSSPEGQATAADLADFAQTGVNIMVFETEKV